MQEGTGHSSIARGIVLDSGKEAIATTVIDAEPDLIIKMPEDDPWPFIVTLAMALGFVGLLLNWWWMAAVGGVATFVGIFIWLWPRADLAQRVEPANE